MKHQPQALGILGGTFDPVHLGHMQLAQTAYQQLELSKVHFIPCKKPLLKTPAQATNEQRLEMLEIACQPYAQFVIDKREIDRESASYMVETLQSLCTEFPQQPLCLLIGLDAYQELPRWHQWQELIKLAHIIVINRPGVELKLGNKTNNELDEFYQRYYSTDRQRLKTQLAGTLYSLKMTPLPYASRELRQQICAGKSVAGALPAGVWDYIQQQHIYSSKT